MHIIVYMCITNITQYVFLDGLSAQDIGNNKEEGSVLVSVPVNAAQRVRSVTQLIHSDSEKKSK